MLGRVMRVVVVLAVAAVGLGVAPAGASSGFGDVRSDDYYGAPVQWLVDEGLTTGVSPGCFAPDKVMNRAELATFLWRYAQEPSAPAHGFADVPAGSFYDDAVAWMAYTGITVGTSDTTFSPGEPVSRAEVATFLWRYAGTPGAPRSSFTDVVRPSFYAPAVDWMVAESLTTGTSDTTFSPTRSITRAEFATFLHRLAGTPSVSIALGGTCLATGVSDPVGIVVFEEDFATAASVDRFSFDIHHRDDFLIHETSWYGDHADNGDGTCGGPDTARLITRGDRDAGFNDDWHYWCPNGTGHVMTAIGDTSGYSIGSFTPRQTFRDVVEVRWDINYTDLGGRQFPEIKVIPASMWDPQNLPCVPAIPCDTDDYDVLGAVGVSALNGDMMIGSPAFPDGDRGDTATGLACSQKNGFCFAETVPDLGNDAGTRLTNVFRDNGNGTMTWLIEQTGTSITVPGSFPTGPVRVVFGDHNYTPHKAPGAQHPLGHSRHTWHWDTISVAVAAG